MKKKSLKNRLLGAFAAVACMIGGGAAVEAQTVASGTKMPDGSILLNQMLMGEKSELPILYVAPHTSPVMQKQNDAFNYCEKMSVGGHADWRLPTQKELTYIAAHKNEGALKKLTKISSRPVYDFFWYEAQYRDASMANLISPQYQGWNDKAYTLCVRDNDKARAGNSEVMPDGSIRVILSEKRAKPFKGVYTLYTTASDAPTALTKGAAAGYCAGLEAHGHKDWRLPSRSYELEIMREARNSAALKGTFKKVANENTNFMNAYATYNWWNGDREELAHAVRCVRVEKPKK